MLAAARKDYLVGPSRNAIPCLGRWCMDWDLRGWRSLKRLSMAWLPYGGRISGVRKQACG